MSSPKVVSPPPRYSARVFDGMLHQVFEGQSRIRSLLSELEGLQIDDRAHGIHLDCADFLRKRAAHCRSLLEPFLVLPPGTFDQATHDQFYSIIKGRHDDVTQALRELVTEQQAFARKKDDHAAYAGYDQYCQRAIQSFQGFQAQVCTNLAEYFIGENASASVRAQLEIKAIAPQVRLAPFKTGFREEADRAKQAAAIEIERSRERVHAIRDQMAKTCLRTLTRRGPLPKSRPARSQEIETLIQEIQTRIAAIDDSSARADYQSKLDRLQSSEVLKDAYFYRELADDLVTLEATCRFKGQVAAAFADVPAAKIHTSLRAEYVQMAATVTEVLDKARVKRYEVDDLCHRIQALERSSQDLVTAEFVAQRERDFLRRHIVESLNRLGYKVIDDTSVVDFEKAGELLLQIPEQDNVLNLDFGEDGSITYRFLIPEARDQLSQEAKGQKLREMDQSCRNFHRVLDGLRDIGVELPITRRAPEGDSALIQIPAQHRAKVQTAASRRRAQPQTQPKHRHLNPNRSDR